MTWTEIWANLLHLFNHSSLFVQSSMLFVFIVVLPVALFAACAVQIKSSKEKEQGERTMSGQEEREIVEREMELFEEELSMVAKIPLEDKLVAAYEERTEILRPWEIDNLVQEAMAQLPEDLTQDQKEDIHDIMFEAITTAIDSVR